MLCPGLFPLGKRQEREADRSPPSSAEVKNVSNYIFTSPKVFKTWYLVKHRDNFTFTFSRVFEKSSEENI
jgi:hypothetical protein